MAVPKHKVSKSKRDMRRSHDALKASVYQECPNCGEFIYKVNLGNSRGKKRDYSFY